jgi:hypothetical protein
MSLVDLVKHLGLLREKLSLYEQTKAFVEAQGEQFNSGAISEILLDLDQYCVGPLLDEIEKIERVEVTIHGKAEKEPGKEKASNQKGSGKAGAKRRGRSNGS